ncbi:MAG: NAD(P)/FAD-dependent oxidoreductase [Candidatus Aminicenantes bacterium]|nr:NAD(P)/FAD-dependent oxidoreductase [Candidatus Aminicenantes bacterium]
MNVVIVGNGLAGTMAAKTIRELDDQAVVTVFAAEDRPYYPRPNLIEFIAGRMPEENIYAFPAGWAGKNRIDLRLGTPVRSIRPAEKTVEAADGSVVPYDALLLADGASAGVPPIAGTGKSGVFTVRTFNDARALLAYFETHRRVAVLGGGLLGLEIARALKARDAEVTVAEIFPSLLPRQLDSEGGEILKARIESGGIRVLLGAAADEITGDPEARGIRFKDGSILEADLIVLAAGVRPNTALAREAGLNVDKGVVVDDRMATNAAGVFAAGDGTQHRGRLYGIIPASFAQARVAAENICGREKSYAGTVPSNQLKVSDLPLMSAGIIRPEGPGFEEVRLARPETGVYKKIVLLDGILAGAVWMGVKTGAAEVGRAVAEGRNVAAVKSEILEDDFDFKRL